MFLLVLGVLLWSCLHLMKSAARPVRAKLVSALGEKPYAGVFALCIVGSIVLMVLGWRDAPVSPVYLPPEWSRVATLLLMLVALFLFVASGVPTNVKRFLRHPQLTGVATWSAAHLLSNGDSRSLVLFGGLGVWTLLEMVFINRRDGAWERPEAQPFSADLKPLVVSLAAFGVLYLAHPYLFGVSARPF